MDVTIPAGSSLTLVAGLERVTLRTLAQAAVSTDRGSVEDATGATSIPVIGPSEALAFGPGSVDIITSNGVIGFSARLLGDDQAMLLRLGSPSQPTQRRQEVRGDVELTIHVTMSGGPHSTDQPLRVVTGHTRNVSAGGLLAVLDLATSPSVRPGKVLPIDIELEDGELMRVMLQVIEVTAFGLRGSFVALEHALAEKLARIVFARERERLAARRLRADVRTGLIAPPPGRTTAW